MNDTQKKTALYDVRKKLGLTQRQVADSVGVEPNHISKLENGERKLSPEWLDRLSKALGCTKAELLGEEPAESLTPEEKILLSNFRVLSQDKKDVIKATADAFAESVRIKDSVG